MSEFPGICIFTETYHPVVGGGEIQAQNLAIELAAEGFPVIVLTRRSGLSFRKVENSGQVTIYRVSPTGTEHFKKWALLFTGLAALIKLRRKYDLIIVSGFRVIGITAILVGKVLGKPCILKADSLGEMSGEFFVDGLKKLGLDHLWFLFKIFLSFRNNILRRADAFVAISSDVESELIAHGIPEEKIHRIPNSVNADLFRPVDPGDKRVLRQKLGISQEEKVVIYTGRLVTYKGLPLLLEVWRELSRSDNYLRLLLVGSGGIDIHNCEAELREFVRRNGIHSSVSFVGEVQNVYEYLQASDIFVFPTENEAFGIALIEAMACGLPVVSTSIGGAKDILRNEMNGLVVKAGHFQELYTALERLIDDNAFSEYLGKNARRTVQEGYTSNLLAQNYSQRIRNLFAASRTISKKRALLLLSLTVIFLLGAAVRLYRIEAPGILVEREYRSAIIARTIYYENNSSILEWKKQVAEISRHAEPLFEPPITEYLTAFAYRVFNREQLWMARWFTSAFWLIGGAFFYKIVQNVVSTNAAVVSTAYFLLVPLGVLASRSFQPESLMFMMFLISLYTLLRYFESPTMNRLIAAAAISGLAILVKPLPLFAILGAFTSLYLSKREPRKRFIDSHFLILALLALFPGIVYYAWETFISKSLENVSRLNIQPHLLLYPVFWKDWLLVGTDAVGLTPLVAALVGFPLLRKWPSRALVIGLGFGYLIFGLVHTFNIQNVSYYHLQLIPIVGISFGPITDLLLDRLSHASNQWYWRMPILVGLLLVMLYNYREIRSGLNSPYFESEQTAQEIGRIVNHSTKTVYLAPFYGRPLEYLGELSGKYWPRRITYWLYRRPGERELSVEERLDALGFSPEYFIITHFKEYHANHLDLKGYLEKNCPLVAASDQYLIYGSCNH